MSTTEALTMNDIENRVKGRLTGEVAIVTGSTSGLGRAIARVFALGGAAVVVTGRTEANGRAVVEEIERLGGAAAFVAADITIEDDRARLVAAAVQLFGEPTVLVNNASARRQVHAHLHSSIIEVTAEEWDQVLSSDLGSAAAMCRLTIPHMLVAGHGSIVNMSSSTAERTAPMTSAYTAAKAALNALSRAVTSEFSRQGIRCNSLQPGFIVPDGVETRTLPPDTRARYLTRLTTGDDVALAALFLASSEAETIIGVVLPVDCGHTVVRATSLG